MAPKERLLLFFRAGDFGPVLRVMFVFCVVERGAIVCAIAALAPYSDCGVCCVLWPLVEEIEMAPHIGLVKFPLAARSELG